MRLPLAPAPLPAGIVLVPFGIAAMRDARELMRQAYGGDLGDAGISFAGFWEWLTTDPEFDADLMFIAAAGDEIVGLCHCWLGNFVKDLVVAPAWRRRGLGTALLTAALAEFAARGAPSVDLKTDIDNVEAQSLYRRLGFMIVERAG